MYLELRQAATVRLVLEFGAKDTYRVLSSFFP